MRPGFTMSIGLLLVMMVASTAPAGATSPSDVEMNVLICAPWSDPAHCYEGDRGIFEARGPAVQQGLLCANGWVEAESTRVSGRPEYYNVGAIGVITCSDGSGTFRIRLQNRQSPDPESGPPGRSGNPLRWIVFGGTAQYARLHGAGYGFALDPGGWEHADVYVGGVHLEPGG